MNDNIETDFFANNVEKQSSLTEVTEISEYEETPCYAKRRDKRFELMLDVRLLKNKCCGFSYSYFRAMELDGDELILHFPPYQITIIGKNLAPIYDGILEHRLRFIKEEGERFEPLSGNRTFIAKIDIISPSK